MVPRQGFEPWTSALPRMRSTTELSRRMARRGYNERWGPREAPIRPERFDGQSCRAVLTGRVEPRTPCAMAPSYKDSKSKPLSREQKLAQALRTNLRRRKVREKAVVTKNGDEG